jgi:hypothetical protein
VRSAAIEVRCRTKSTFSPSLTTHFRGRPLSAPGARLVLVHRVRTQATAPQPPLIASYRVCQRPKPVAVHGAEPASRHAKDALLLFALPGVWARLLRHAKDPFWFLSVTGHGPTSEAAGTGTSLAAVHQHDPGATYGATATAPRGGPPFARTFQPRASRSRSAPVLVPRTAKTTRQIPHDRDRCLMIVETRQLSARRPCFRGLNADNEHYVK